MRGRNDIQDICVFAWSCHVSVTPSRLAQRKDRGGEGIHSCTKAKKGKLELVSKGQSSMICRMFLKVQVAQQNNFS